MKIFITGKSGYIANNLKLWLKKNNYEVCMLDVRSNSWKSADFRNGDIVVHTAGIVHQQNNNDETLYKSINVDLTYELAKHAKDNGIRQFVFISSMAVFNCNKSLPKTDFVYEDTSCIPNGLYGKSKIEAEIKLKELEDENFTLTIVRPPNVYGPHCKGGYIAGFTKIVKYIPLIPYAYEDVYQSMIYIDNLCEMIKLLIEKNMSGVFLPQDDYEISAVELLKNIADALNKKVFFIRIPKILLKLFENNKIVRKIYGGVAYSKESSRYDCLNYNVVSFPDAIKITVIGNENI